MKTKIKEFAMAVAIVVVGYVMYCLTAIIGG